MNTQPGAPEHRDGQARRRRAAVALGAVAAVVLLIVVALIAFLAGRHGTTTPATPGPAAPGPSGQGAPPPGTGGWDVDAETALATAPMLSFPEQVTQPHALTTATAGPPIRLPTPTATAGRLVPGGFPATPEGAVGQLAALTETGLAGGDPTVYAQAYQSVALPGAPAADTTPMFTNLEILRSHAGISATGAVNGLSITYKTTDGLVKGTTDAGRYAVVCVLGELAADYQGQAVSGGFGDCQAMRYVQGEWRISPGAPAFKAPSAWPGTPEAVAAGYRGVTG